jgi:hypothetical protein
MGVRIDVSIYCINTIAIGTVRMTINNASHIMVSTVYTANDFTNG